MGLKPLCQKLVDRLDIEPLDIRFEDTVIYNNFCLKEKYVGNV